MDRVRGRSGTIATMDVVGIHPRQIGAVTMILTTTTRDDTRDGRLATIALSRAMDIVLRTIMTRTIDDSRRRHGGTMTATQSQTSLTQPRRIALTVGTCRTRAQSARLTQARRMGTRRRATGSSTARARARNLGALGSLRT